MGLNAMNDVCQPHNSITGFSWVANGTGFGQFVFKWNGKKERLELDSEMMSKDFVKQMLCQMVDEATDIS